MSPVSRWSLLATTALLVVANVYARPQSNNAVDVPLVLAASASPTVSDAEITSTSSDTAETSIPSSALPINSLPPAQASLPPRQAWCPSEIFCAGPLLQTINLVQPFGDSKTFVDKPTIKNENATVAIFNSMMHNPNSPPTIGSVIHFIDANFKGEGLELKSISVPESKTPAFLADESIIPDPLARSWAEVVNGYWSTLVRTTDQSVLCPDTAAGCESSLIPLNHTFVVPGGRFREQYYWDSFWIMEGLLKSELYDIAKSSLENFMDEIQQFGFIPNGGRIYYLNRSQPPVFIKMLARYVNVTSDTSILARALPLAEAELQWWKNNRTISVTSPYTHIVHSVSHYAVNNTAPRPESYLEDYETVNGMPLSEGATKTDLNGFRYTPQEQADLYSEIASGAETGWDYSSRFTKDPLATLANTTDQEPLMRGLNVRATIPVDLNSILYDAMIQLAELYSLAVSTPTAISQLGKPGDKRMIYAVLAQRHRADAAQRKAAILDLMWDPEKMAFYDFNLTSNARGGFFSAAHFYPMWNGIWPDQVTGGDANRAEEVVQKMFAPVGFVLSRYNGTFPATFMRTGAQWDAPNAWPPHQYIIIQALANVPSRSSTKPYPALDSSTTSFSLLPHNQLGLPESQLPLQPLASGQNVSTDLNYVKGGTWTLGGNPQNGETWSQALLRGMANRYFGSVFCSWYSTGGSIPGVLNQLSAQELNATFSTPASEGHMYEKFDVFDVDAAGSGGEYTVQAGFGWTNGAVLWVAANYGKLLDEPMCPGIDIRPTANAEATATSVAIAKAKRMVAGTGTKYHGQRKTQDGKYLVALTQGVNRKP